jgi:hypothetical protein
MLAAQHIAEVNWTGVNFGKHEAGSSPSVASMIHSADLPLNEAPGGGSSVKDSPAGR